MAKGYRKKRKYRKRQAHRNYKSIRNDKTLLGDKVKVVMKYADTLNMNPAAASADYYVFSANGLYNPNITGIGTHQPRGYDQVMALYDHYVTIYAKIRVDFANLSAVPLVVGIASSDTTTSRSITGYMESRDVNYKILDAVGGNSRATIQVGLSVAKFLGRSKILSDPECKGTSLSNPIEGAFFHLFCFAPDGSDPSGCTAIASLEYTTMFIEPHQPPIS